MAEMEDKFQEILGNEQAMSQIMSIAQSMTSTPQEERTEPPQMASQPLKMEDMMGGLDPKLMAMGMRLMTAYQTEHRSTGLMTALRPFVKEERQVMMDRLSQATKLAKVATCLIAMWGEDGEDV